MRLQELVGSIGCVSPRRTGLRGVARCRDKAVQVRNRAGTCKYKLQVDCAIASEVRADAASSPPALAILACGLALVAASCGGQHIQATSATNGVHVTLASITAATESAKSFRFAFTEDALGITTRTTGVIDVAHDASDIVVSNTGKPPRSPEEWVTIGTSTWMGPIGEPAQWQMFEGSASPAIVADGGFDPATLFDRLQSEGLRLTYAGKATIGGTATRRFRAILTEPVSIPSGIGAGGGHTTAYGTGTIWVDDRGRVLRFTQRITVNGSKLAAALLDSTASGTFEDFNAKVTITPPG